MEKALVASPATLNARHAELDQRLSAEESRPFPDGTLVARLKKTKLKIKDALTRG